MKVNGDGITGSGDSSSPEAKCKENSLLEQEWVSSLALQVVYQPQADALM